MKCYYLVFSVVLVFRVLDLYSLVASLLLCFPPKHRVVFKKRVSGYILSLEARRPLISIWVSYSNQNWDCSQFEQNQNLNYCFSEFKIFHRRFTVFTGRCFLLCCAAQFHRTRIVILCVHPIHFHIHIASHWAGEWTFFEILKFWNFFAKFKKLKMSKHTIWWFRR